MLDLPFQYRNVDFLLLILKKKYLDWMSTATFRQKFYKCHGVSKIANADFQCLQKMTIKPSCVVPFSSNIVACSSTTFGLLAYPVPTPLLLAQPYKGLPKVVGSHQNCCEKSCGCLHGSFDLNCTNLRKKSPSEHFIEKVQKVNVLILTLCAMSASLA